MISIRFFKAVFLLLFILGCKKITYREHFFIPNHYTGWVNIVYVDSGYSDNVVLDKNSESVVFYITKNPTNFRINKSLEKYSLGRFVTDTYYYYDNDTLIHLKTLNTDSQHIFRGGTQGFYYDKVRKIVTSINVVSFYVSEKGYDGEISDDMLKENPIDSYYSMNP